MDMNNKRLSTTTSNRLRTKPKSFQQKMREQIAANRSPEMKELIRLEHEEAERKRRLERLELESAALDAEVEAGYQP